MDFPDHIETERLILGPYKTSDLDGHVAVMANWDVTKWLSTNVAFPYSEEDGKKFIAQVTALRETGKSMVYAITDKATGRHVGGIRIFSLTSESEIGYWMGPDFWGKGLGTEILRAVIKTGFDSGIIKMFVAMTAEKNAGSRRILEKVGFTHDGTPPEEYARCGHMDGCTEFFRLPITTWASLQEEDGK